MACLLGGKARTVNKMGPLSLFKRGQTQRSQLALAHISFTQTDVNSISDTFKKEQKNAHLPDLNYRH